MSLFAGVENFTPAFTGQQIAIGAGQGAGNSISRGMQLAKQGQLQTRQIAALDTWANDWMEDSSPGASLGSHNGLDWWNISNH